MRGLTLPSLFVSHVTLTGLDHCGGRGLMRLLQCLPLLTSALLLLCGFTGLTLTGHTEVGATHGGD